MLYAGSSWRNKSSLLLPHQSVFALGAVASCARCSCWHFSEGRRSSCWPRRFVAGPALAKNVSRMPCCCCGWWVENEWLSWEKCHKPGLALDECIWVFRCSLCELNGRIGQLRYFTSQDCKAQRTWSPASRNLSRFSTE